MSSGILKIFLLTICENLCYLNINRLGGGLYSVHSRHK
nr:MAG TPA: hypothetical protein [Caudoviricetes sp.]